MPQKNLFTAFQKAAADQENKDKNMSAYETIANAILTCNLSNVKTLLNRYKFDAKSMKYLLQMAMNDSTEEISKELIKNMQDFKLGWLLSTDGSYHKLAIDKYWPDVLNLMIDRGATFKKYDSLDVNPMHYAAKSASPKFVKILARVVPVDTYEDEEYTPLMVAAENGNDQTMDALLSMGANPEAVQKPRVTIDYLVPSLLRAFFVVSTMAPIDSVIHKAAYSGNPKTIDVLLKHRNLLDLNASGTDLKTPLMIATERKHIDMVHHLLKLGVNVNRRTVDKNALHYAVEANSIEITKLLLEYGIDQMHNTKKTTALDQLLHESRKYGIQNPELIDLLKYAKANPQKVKSQKPYYYPGYGPNHDRTRNN